MKKILIILLFLCFLCSNALAADYFDWSVRTDRDGKPAGIFTTTPFPITEATTSYTIVNDEGSHTYTINNDNSHMFFVDGSGTNCSNGSTNYIPSTRTCSGGTNYTVYTTLYNAFNSVTTGNNTILVRAGTYTWDSEWWATNHSGNSDTQRYIIAGYGQERPVLDGTGYSFEYAMIMTGSNQYLTFQRLTLQHSNTECMRVALDQEPAINDHTNIIDVFMNNCDTTGVAPYGSGAIILERSQYPWVYHVTTEHNYDHGIKIADGTSHSIVEWCDTHTSGYWSGISLPAGGKNAVCYDMASGYGGTVVQGSYNTVRYSIAYDCLQGCTQIRNQDNFSIHHNEFYNCPRRNNVDVDTGGYTFEGSIWIWTHESDPNYLGTKTYGNIYSNVIRNPEHGTKVGTDCTASTPKICEGIGIGLNVDTGANYLNIYNNLAYDTDIPIYIYGSYSTVKYGIYNNTFMTSGVPDGSSVTTVGFFQTPFTALISQGNIFYQTTSAHNCVTYQGAATNSYNDYYGCSTTGAGTETGAITSDPSFVSTPSGAYTSGMGNIQTSSPAKDAFPTASAPTGIFTRDIMGNLRGYGTGWDIGAYEYLGGGDTTPPAAPTGLSVN